MAGFGSVVGAGLPPLYAGLPPSWRGSPDPGTPLLTEGLFFGRLRETFGQPNWRGQETLAERRRGRETRAEPRRVPASCSR